MFYQDIADIDEIAEDELSAGRSCVSLYNECWELDRKVKAFEEVVKMTVEQAGAELNNSIKPFNPQLLYSKGIDALATK